MLREFCPLTTAFSGPIASGSPVTSPALVNLMAAGMPALSIAASHWVTPKG